MTRSEMLLVQLMEECDELSQRASKALRFGLDEIQPGQLKTNRERMHDEFVDLLAVARIIEEDGGLPNTDLEPEQCDEKRLKVEKFLRYSEKCGTLQVAP